MDKLYYWAKSGSFGHFLKNDEECSRLLEQNIPIFIIREVVYASWEKIMKKSWITYLKLLKIIKTKYSNIFHQGRFFAITTYSYCHWLDNIMVTSPINDLF